MSVSAGVDAFVEVSAELLELGTTFAMNSRMAAQQMKPKTVRMSA